ncbi:MAG: hypothetical protein AUG48_03480 [Actinobacteria bacterium 13_1_20CM_3_68_9]|nr:MAG: hypothetical protein AUG48_03480 [Actinobacteria bacterium 13_1_20CM_3_68_9]
MALLCFPSAGGDTAAYRGWQEAFGPEVEVLPAALPGRGRRIEDALIGSITEMADALVEPAIDAIASRPAVLFGHSMGALIAFELAHRLMARDATPELLVLSGTPGPDDAGLVTDAYDGKSDREIVDFVRSLGLTPEEIFDYPDLQELLLPVLRNDIEASGRYTAPPRAPLPVPLLVLSGSHDPLVDPARLRLWGKQTTQETRVVVFDGGHDFVNVRRELVVEAINEAVGVAAAVRSL